MRVTACSIFRDSAGYVNRYLAQMANLAHHVDLRLVLTYGDCNDDTADKLTEEGQAWGLSDRMEVDRFDHGGPHYGSVDNPARWDQIAKVVRSTLDRVGDPGDALVWVESDLRWHTDSMVALLRDLDYVPAVAPLLLASDNPTRYYDTWGYRKDGEMFNGQPPYYRGQPRSDLGGLVKIDSCGSCWVTDGDAWREWSGHWPYPAGDCLWLDPTVTVRHP